MNHVRQSEEKRLCHRQWTVIFQKDRERERAWEREGRRGGGRVRLSTMPTCQLS